ncbi:MAG: hypothetical protein LBQ57_13715 [Spirochaetales bacterium]|jgi:hypothetical protein|nr:hypothetical protein [Spirochaetales bacterium]
MLFFKSAEKPVQTVAPAPPRAPRYTSVARVRINGFEGEAILRNISSSGFRMESRTYASITVGEKYSMEIQPEANAGVKAFGLDVEVRWVQSTETNFSSGFFIIRPPIDKSLEKYINYIKTRN